MRGEVSAWTSGLVLLLVVATAIWGVVAWAQWISVAQWLSTMYTAEGFVVLGLIGIITWRRWIPAKITPWLGATVGIGVAQMNRAPQILQAVHGWMLDHRVLAVVILWMMRGSLIVLLLAGLMALALYIWRLFSHTV